MIRKALLILMMLIFTACSGATATHTADFPTAAPTVITATAIITTEAPTATETPVDATNTPYPTNIPDCTNIASFVEDVTIPDNTIIEPNTNFTKTWRVKNTGTCIWNPEYTLAYYSGEQMGGLIPIPLTPTQPGETTDISIELTAPDIEGSHQGNFVIKNPAGLVMQVDQDSRLWVIVSVSQTTEAQPAETAPADNTCAYTIDNVVITSVVNAINAYRTQNGIVAYTTDSRLQEAAQRHAIDMACNQFYTHDGTDGSTPESRVADTGYNALSVSENVYGSSPRLIAQDVVAWWATDQTDARHNENLISTQYTQIGVGYAFFDNYGFYVVVFAQP